MPYPQVTNITTPLVGDFSGSNQGSSVSGSPSPTGRDYESYWDSSNVAADWWKHEDVFAHNEALAASARDARNAREQRDYETYMSNTAFQRKVADYVKAGFSPLAALEGSIGASTPSGSAASAKQAQRGSNNFGGVLGAIISAMAILASKGMSAASAAANQSARNATQVATTLAKNETMEKVAEAKIAAQQNLVGNKAEWFGLKNEIMKKYISNNSTARGVVDFAEKEVSDAEVKEALRSMYEEIEKKRKKV